MTTDKNLEDWFLQIIEQHTGILYKVARSYCSSDTDRQDLIQEMMIQVWKSLPRYDNSYAITTWLYRIALNTAISYYRNTSKRGSLNVPLLTIPPIVSEEMDVHKQEQLKLLEQFIDELDKLDKAFMLLFLEGKSHADIGLMLGFTTSNVGTRIGRIKEKLKNKYLLSKPNEND